MARLRRRRPNCPHCQGPLPPARLRCPHCDHELVGTATCAAWERPTRALVTELLREPWMTSGRLLSYGLASTQRGFLRRYAPELDSRLLPLIHSLRAEVSEPAAQLLLEHLEREVVRPRSRLLARCFASCARDGAT